jgi:peptidoglycan/LPS O-acetylase OafA/YrhL
MSYKPHIDGLRAFAVLAVVLYHFRVGAFGGGYVGVDVFFVISGYLLTGIIVAELEQGAFTFTAFYARRARRILPASLCVVAVVALVGWLRLPPSDLDVLGRSIVSTVCFASNLFFFAQSGYFGPDGRTLHLLHTWSLAVEEQFYLLLPLLLFSLRGLGRARIFWIVAACGAASALLSVLLTPRQPAMAFYLLPTRAWELLAGALLAIRRPALAGGPRLASSLALVGFASFGVSVFWYGPDTPFPGVAAALPVLAAALLIAAGDRAAPLVRWPLTNPVSVGIGKISYSMYLWHWPLLVFYEVTFEGKAWLTPLLIVPLLPLSYVSYRFVEQPFRKPGFWSPRPKIALALAASLLLGSFGAIAAETHGTFKGMDARVAAIAGARDNRRRDETNGGVCFSGVPWNEFAVAECLEAKPGARTVLLWGDSVAAHHSAGLRAAARGTDVQILEATMVGCSPWLGWRAKNRPHCRERNDGVLAFVEQHPPSLVLVAGHWPFEKRPDEYRPYLERTLAALHDLGLRVIVLGPPIEYTRPLPEFVVQHIQENKPFHTADYLGAATKKVEVEMKSGVVPLGGARLVSLFDLLCAGWECPALTPEQLPVQWDTRHLTYEGSLLAGKKLFPIIQAELAKKAPRP